MIAKKQIISLVVYDSKEEVKLFTVLFDLDVTGGFTQQIRHIFLFLFPCFYFLFSSFV